METSSPKVMTGFQVYDQAGRQLGTIPRLNGDGIEVTFQERGEPITLKQPATGIIGDAS